jgi:hypothetical protein
VNDYIIEGQQEKEDPWMLNLGYSLLKQWDKALACILVIIVVHQSFDYILTNVDKAKFYDVFNL